MQNIGAGVILWTKDKIEEEGVREDDGCTFIINTYLSIYACLDLKIKKTARKSYYIQKCV